MAGEGLTWRKRILQKLGDRNLQELKYFDDLVKAHNRLFEIADSSKSKITQLEIQTFQLQQERTELQGRIQELSSSGAGAAAATATSEKVASLEQKLFKTQEELTELHRWKSENAQHVTELMNQIRQKEEDVSQKEGQLQDAITNQNAMKTECQNLGQTIVDLQKANELIKDELQVLQLEYTSLDDKFKKTQVENRELVERWMIQKAKDADKVNMENELQVRTRQAKLQRELLEAAKEPVNIPNVKDNVSDSPHIPYCVITTIPAFPQTKFDAHDGEVLSAKFSISGRLFVTGGGDKKVKVWETVNDTVIPKGTMHGCTYAVTSVQFDVQEKLILAASNDQACRVWTVADERLRHTLTGHQNKVMTAKFMGSDAYKVVSGSHDRTLKIWDLRSKACIRTVFAGSSCNDLVINELIGSQIISGHFDKRVRFWDSRSDTSVSEITLQGKVTSLDLSPDMNQVLASTRDDTVKVIDLRMSQVVSTCSGDGFRLATDWTRACFSPDGQYVMCGSQDGSVYIWNNSTAKLEKVLKEHSSGVIVAAWHPTGTSIISCDRNKHAVVWTSRYG